jgi:L-2-hydroxyglutarate oxidase LhgO
MQRIDSLVIGAGVVGLAIARELARAGREVVIAERGRLIGSSTSSRNSEVIHAGIYYPAGSLKALACVEGRRCLYDFCDAYGVNYRRCGKLIVATNDNQLIALESIAAAGRANGVDDLRVVSGGEAQAMEPALRASGALHSPSTGIIDSHGYMLALLGSAEDAGAVLALDSDVTELRPVAGGVDIFVDGEAAPILRAGVVINSAGLSAHHLAGRIRDFPGEHVPSVKFAKGNYFTLQGKAPFSRLIYPVPEPGGLGTHLTLDLAGAARFGPDVEWVDAEDYAVDPARAQRFYASVRAYWPGLADDTLQPGYAGIRPKIGGLGAPASDFILSGPETHGVPGIVNLFGIESPGLTASLALAGRVAAIAEKSR